MPLLTDLATALIHGAVRAAAPFNPKARQWVDGRKGLWERLEAKREALQGCLWMHCASVGEFEQGRSVLEAIKRERPDLPVLLTFFSPSGFEARKDLGSTAPGSLVTHVEYLPPDGAANARRLLDLVQPILVLWVKYELWHHHLQALRSARIPTYLISAYFWPTMPYFRWYGGAWRRMLGCFTHHFVQDDRSGQLLRDIGLENVTVSGDTRFDRVLAIVEANETVGAAEAFHAAAPSPVLVCGSTWPVDEELLLKALTRQHVEARLLVAPHELHAQHLSAVESSFPKPLALWSELEKALVAGAGLPPGIRTVLVDRMGLLARIYRYGDIAYVGGGFGDGIHSLLEPAAWGCPVILGPLHTKFPEAQGLIDVGGGFEVRNAEELLAVLDRLLGDPAALAKASDAARRYVQERAGATDRIVSTISGRLGT
jgi:3-deoxy-D-manno-octulosonic-acid transferase